MSISPPNEGLTRITLNATSRKPNQKGQDGTETQKNRREKMQQHLFAKIGHTPREKKAVLARTGTIEKTEKKDHKEPNIAYRYRESIKGSKRETTPSIPLKLEEFPSVGGIIKNMSKGVDGEAKRPPISEQNYIVAAKVLIRESSPPKLPDLNGVPKNIADQVTLENKFKSRAAEVKFEDNKPYFKEVIDIAKKDMVDIFNEESLYRESLDSEGYEQREHDHLLTKKILNIASDLHDLKEAMDDVNLDKKAFLKNLSRVVSDMSYVKARAKSNIENNIRFNSEVKPERLGQPPVEVNVADFDNDSDSSVVFTGA